METTQYLNQWVTQKASYNQRDLLLYSMGIGATDLRWAYENDGDFAAFPTYPLVLLFKGDSEDVVSFPSPAMMEGPPLPPLPGIKVGLDGERYVEMIRPLDPEGSEITMKSRLIGIHKRGTGASVETEVIMSDAKGPVYRLVSGAFLVGAKDFKDSGSTNSEAVAVPKRNPDKEVEVKISETMPLLYRLSGDYNPLHVEEGLAQMSGFEAPINHGLCTFGISCHQVLKHMLDNDPAKFKAIKGRFASPVLPGQTIVVKMWQEKDRIIFTTTVKETGKVCINNSYVLINQGGAKL
jgi:acyl dehydratase